MKRSLRTRATALTLAASLLLAGCGAVALVLAPNPAGAGVTPGVTPEFTLKPGQTGVEEFSKVMINSAEARPEDADACRDDPIISLTCSSHRIKLTNLAPGYVLKMVVEWPAQGADALAVVPDIDIYLFDGATSHFDSGDVGGATGAEPEEISITPTQTEYDLVVQDYAGVVTEHKVTVSYTIPEAAKTDGPPPPSPDFYLSPDAKPFVKEYTSALVMTPLIVSPGDCRTAPEYDVQCDVYRFKVNRSKEKGAVNYVVLSLEWDAVTVPALSTPAIGTVSQFLPNMDFYVFDTDDHHLPTTGGGTSLRLPERMGFVATQDEYDLVIQVFEGASTGYKLTAFMTDELFDKPFELLDPVTGAPVAPGVDPDTGFFNPWKAGDSEMPPLGLAPIDVDSQIAGIGLGATEQFDSQEAIRLGGQALRNTSTTHEPPSTLILLLALVLAPAVLLGGGVAVVRRRNHVAF